MSFGPRGLSKLMPVPASNKWRLLQQRQHKFRFNLAYYGCTPVLNGSLFQAGLYFVVSEIERTVKLCSLLPIYGINSLSLECSDLVLRFCALFIYFGKCKYSNISEIKQGNENS